MKMAPIIEEFSRRAIPQLLIHTGQHYDVTMSRTFFEELRLPEPNANLGIGSDTHAKQTARIMIALEDLFLDYRPDLVIVAGDVNSTIAAALVASKLQLPVAHIEAGLRSFDRTMPEESNRIVTDHLSDLLFTTEESGNENLRNEGISKDKIFFVGNCMVDTLLKYKEVAHAKAAWTQYGLSPQGYALLTLHRPSNVDSLEQLTQLMSSLNNVAERLPVVFPVHPRTRSRLADNMIELRSNILVVEPLPYLEFLSLMSEARLVLTDSGGIQEETTALNIPCLTLRDNTERPVTVDLGTNRLVSTNPSLIIESVEDVLTGSWKNSARPPLWDGLAHMRIADIVENWLRR